GRFKPWGGSLGDVLPATFRPKFESAAALPAPASVEWIGASGTAHALRVVPPCENVSGSATIQASVAVRDSASDNFAALADPCALPRVSVTEALGIAPASVEAMRSDETGQRLAGILVHRLFERQGTSMAGDITEELRRLLRDE